MTKRLTAEEVADYMDAIRGNNVAIRRYEVAHAIDACAIVVRENLIESDDQRRERFEQWRRTAWGNLTEQDLERDPDDETYVSGSVQDQFAAWQAALTYRDAEES